MKKFRPRLRTKNHSCEYLKPKNKNLRLFPKRSLIRFGSTTPNSEIFVNNEEFVEVNSIEAIKNSRSKLLMKQCFSKAKVNQSNWWTVLKEDETYYFYPQHDTSAKKDTIDTLSYPILAKRIFGYKAKGMVKIDSKEDMVKFLKTTPIQGYYFELFYNFAREYRIHCTQDKAFLRWRKLRKTDANERWYFNSSNCIWAGEDNELFQTPSNMKEVDTHCINAIKSVGLDIGAVDIRIQSAKSDTPAFIILEVNSAPSLGEMGNKVYASQIEEIINFKINNNEVKR